MAGERPAEGPALRCRVPPSTAVSRLQITLFPLKPFEAPAAHRLGHLGETLLGCPGRRLRVLCLLSGRQRSGERRQTSSDDWASASAPLGGEVPAAQGPAHRASGGQTLALPLFLPAMDPAHCPPPALGVHWVPTAGGHTQVPQGGAGTVKVGRAPCGRAARAAWSRDAALGASSRSVRPPTRLSLEVNSPDGGPAAEAAAGQPVALAAG